MALTGCKYIDDYIRMVRCDIPKPYCKYQHKLCDFIEKIFDEEELWVDEEQLEKYLAFQKYFPYDLLPWEKFIFTLVMCTYTKDGDLRFPYSFVNVGRGAGKNGLISFIVFCLLTPVHGVREYDVYIYAMSEDQAKTSWMDIYNILEDNKKVMSKFFYWTKEVITNLATRSSLYFCTSSSKTKDGQRPGAVIFDEYHAFESMKTVNVAETGLGKKKNSRKFIITTNGLVRGGPFDTKLDESKDILEGEETDDGQLPYICCIDDMDEIDNEESWFKANPSLYEDMATYWSMIRQMRIEYKAYKRNPAENISFPAKRMNLPPAELENEVTSWDNVKATNQPIDEELIKGRDCVGGIDYMKTTDFLSAGLLYKVDEKYYWIQKTWVCRNSRDLVKVKAPLEAWAAKGDIEYVDAKEIPPELPAAWLANEAAKRGSRIIRIGIDSYRYSLMSKALLDINFSADKGWENVILVRPRDEMYNIPLITSGFNNYSFCFGDTPVLRWAINNSTTVTSPQGNITYGKIEPKGRKTDPFKAFVAAFCVSDILDKYQNDYAMPVLDVVSF